MSSRMTNVARRVGIGMRDAWLMLGIVALMIAALEIAYRAQAGMRKAVRADRGSRGYGPYADSAWFASYVREYEATFNLHWKPYVYFRRPPFAGTFINVDSAGHRRTIPAPRAAPDTLRVFFFGGSTMWGTYLRDSTTIASVAARRLAEPSKDSVTIDVTNFGESGYVFTQEILELEMQLRAGHVPHAVVFYDGINDVAAAGQSGEAGIPQNESNRSREFEFGRSVWGSETGAGSDWRAARAIAGATARRFQFIQRLRAFMARPPKFRSADDIARDVANVYAKNVDLVEALGRAHGFKAVYVWQPTLHATQKKLTPFERTMLSEDEADTFEHLLIGVHRAITPLIDPLMRSRVGARFVNQSSLFRDDSNPVFMDQIGHNTEQSIPAIVDGFLPPVQAILDSVAARPRIHPSPRTTSAAMRRKSDR